MDRLAGPVGETILRAPVAADAPAVLEVLLARDVADFGRPDFTLEDLLDDWGESEFDLAADAVVCETGEGEIIAYGALRRGACDVYVSPAREGEGIGTRLLAWVLERERGRPRHRQAVAHTNARAAALLRDHGYRFFLSYSRMVSALDGAALEAPAPPPGVDLRPVAREADAEVLHTLDGQAFADSPDYMPMSFQAFCERHLDQNDHAPEFSLVAEREGHVAGFLLACRREEESAGYVDILAVAPGHQGQGIGTAMLHTALARFSAAGLREAQLGVASTNPGARGLYERAGLRERFRVDVYERPGDPR